MSVKDRRDFLDARRRRNAERMDTIFAPIYDDNWGSYINPTHRRHVEELLRLVGSAATPTVLDAGCGTGKYWPMLLDAGCEVYGIDHSTSMLAKATARYPGVSTRACALQDLGTETDLDSSFDGLLCVDALENVGPEDWPIVLRNLQSTLREGAPAYLTVELAEGDEEPEARNPLLVEGEVLANDSYHYYPTPAQVEAWLSGAGFQLLSSSEGDGYLHLMCISART